MSNVWNIFKKKKLDNNQTLTKKESTFLWCPVEDINISDIFYQIQKFRRASWASIIRTNDINFLMAGPLKAVLVLFLRHFDGESSLSWYSVILVVNRACPATPSRKWWILMNYGKGFKLWVKFLIMGDSCIIGELLDYW